MIEADHILGVVVQEQHGKGEHQDGTDHPVLDQREAEDFPVAKHVAQFLVLHLRQRRVHHQDEADGDGDVRRVHPEPIDEGLDAGDEVAQPDANGHRQENPEGQKAVEKR